MGISLLCIVVILVMAWYWSKEDEVQRQKILELEEEVNQLILEANNVTKEYEEVKNPRLHTYGEYLRFKRKYGLY